MRKKISFIILGYAGSSIRQISASRSFLSILGLLVLGCIFGVGYMVRDYYQVKEQLLSLRILETKITHQAEEIKDQRKQIQTFASRINTLKSKLVDLNNFEKKIRIIAGIDEKAVQEGLFGVGGSIPLDLDTSVPLAEKHGALIRGIYGQIDQLGEASAGQKESFGSLLKHLEKQINILACTPSIRPTRGWVTSKFGRRNSPFTGLHEFHKGLDIATQFKSPIVAPADGRVTFIGYKGPLGKVIIIDHGHGLVTRYGHIHKALKKRGEQVKRGDVIALVGKTGRATGSHVHYEVHLNGIPVNPEKYILN